MRKDRKVLLEELLEMAERANVGDGTVTILYSNGETVWGKFSDGCMGELVTEMEGILKKVKALMRIKL